MSDRNVSRILFVCTGNAGRSQMAEALARQRWGNQVEVMSGGVAPWSHLHPMAIKLMSARNLSLTAHYPKHVDTWLTTDFNIVVMIGDPAKNLTPLIPGDPIRLFWDISDPAFADQTPHSETAFQNALIAIEEHLGELEQFFE